MKTTHTKKIALASVVLAFLGAVAFAPASNAASTSHSITVNAEGSVKVVPDAVRLTATATVMAANNKSALSETSKVASAVRKALLENGVASSEIATQSISSYPEYNYTADGGSQLVGYRASQSFVVTIKKASNAGAVVDAVVAAGGDNLQVTGVSPFVLDATKSSLAARAAAVKNARAKALSYAKLLGVKLGRVITLSESSGPSVYPVMSVAKDSAGATEIDLGQQDVTVAITVKWAIY
jgi:uncharacterized protein YggE